VNIKDLRAKFHISVCDENVESSTFLTKHLNEQGFTSESFIDYQDMLDRIPQEAPHIVIVSTRIASAAWMNAAQSVKRLSEEIMILGLLSPMMKCNATSGMSFDQVMRWDRGQEWEVVKALDSFCRMLIFKYQNETQARSAAAVQKTIQEEKSNSLPFLNTIKSDIWDDCYDWFENLADCNHHDEATEILLESIFADVSAPVLFLKYSSAHMSLLPTISRGVSNDRLKGVGISLKEEGDATFSILKTDPSKYVRLSLFVQTIVGSAHFQAFPIETRGELKGLVLIIQQHIPSDLKARLQTKILSFQMAYENLHLAKRLHNVDRRDEVTQFLNRHSFQEKLVEEVSRARRTGLPVSLIMIDVDNFSEYQNKRGRIASDHLLKMLATILRRTSRVNDILARLGPDELAMLLPHTHQRGAAIKAERLRRIIEATTFAKEHDLAIHITISVGVSEYPALCSDADDLLMSADQAVSEVKKRGKNKVCMASVMEGFNPDKIPFYTANSRKNTSEI
jgi:diguanylate cyclase (GGDEF)-like protein